MVDKPSGAKLSLPDGFSVNIWAEGFDVPRYMLQGNNGEILLSDMGRNGGVYVVPQRRSRET